MRMMMMMLMMINMIIMIWIILMLIMTTTMVIVNFKNGNDSKKDSDCGYGKYILITCLVLVLDNVIRTIRPLNVNMSDMSCSGDYSNDQVYPDAGIVNEFTRSLTSG